MNLHRNMKPRVLTSRHQLRVAVTRSAEQSKNMNALFNRRGVSIISCPVIEIQPVRITSALRVLRKELSEGKPRYDWLIFLSVNAVRMLGKALGNSAGNLKKVSVLAVGPKTAAAARSGGGGVKKGAEETNFWGGVKALGQVQRMKILLPRVMGGPQDLVKALRAQRARVREIPVYRSTPVRLSYSLRKKVVSGVDAVTFTSPRIVKYFLASFTKAERAKIFLKAKALSIGPQTTHALRSARISPVIEAPESTMESLAKTILKRI
jgi:uroporphyrinogen-III synthase